MKYKEFLKQKYSSLKSDEQSQMVIESETENEDDLFFKVC